MKTDLLSWKETSPTLEAGVLTGSDANQEWMLPTWWEHYSKHNAFPVSFIDFGMSKSARIWCEKKGNVIDIQIPSTLITPKEQIPKLRAKFWERIDVSNLWQSRSSWFSKPFALLKTPYAKSIWIDLDCIVKKKLNPIIELLNKNNDFAIAPASARYQKFSQIIGLHKLNERVFNSGVVGFTHGSSVMEKWAENTATRNSEFLGDENVLNRTIHEEQCAIIELPIIYNWPYFLGENAKAAVVHYLSSQGKNHFLQKL